MAKKPDDFDDPELVEMDEFVRLEKARHPDDGRARKGSTALIALAVIVLIALGVGSAWIAGAL